MLFCMSAHWSELAMCLQPQEGHKTDLIAPLETRAEKKKAPSVLGVILPSANLPNKRNTLPTLYQTPQDINLRIPGSPESLLE